MLTNEKITAIHENAVAHGWWEADTAPTFGEYCALIHEEISEAFSAWRNGEPDEYVKDGKPEGVWVELADVVIRCADVSEQYGYDLIKDVAVSTKIIRCSMAEFVTELHEKVTDIIKISSDSLSYVVWAIYLRSFYCGIDLDAIIDRKCAYNAARPWRHGKRM